MNKWIGEKCTIANMAIFNLTFQTETQNGSENPTNITKKKEFARGTSSMRHIQMNWSLSYKRRKTFTLPTKPKHLIHNLDTQHRICVNKQLLAAKGDN